LWDDISGVFRSTKLKSNRKRAVKANAYHDIYHRKALQYEALIQREDYQGNIFPALLEVAPLHGKVVVELGCGTGRFTPKLSQLSERVFAFDKSLAMLEVARPKLERLGKQNWSLEVADHRYLPIQNTLADVVIAGWSICHLVDDHPSHWRTELKRVFAEIRRVLRPGGVVALFETMGTGYETPHPPVHLTEYYNVLQNELNFFMHWIRTDYHFETLQEGEQLTRFFFGDRLADLVVGQRSLVVPECTGLWWSYNCA
jgi:ubiquinone/menaquinone biosynthesis C-methylase UbiE